LSHFLMSHNGQRTLVRYTLLIQRIDGTNVVVGKGAGATWLWIRFPVAVGEVECPPFSWTQSRMNAENAVDLATTHVHAFGHLVRCDIFFYTQILF
jgi:hypothetical protein